MTRYCIPGCHEYLQVLTMVLMLFCIEVASEKAYTRNYYVSVKPPHTYVQKAFETIWLSVSQSAGQSIIYTPISI